MGDNKMINEDKRFITTVENMFLIEKVNYERYCDNLTISSYFVTDEIIDQLESYFPETLVF